MNVIKSSGNVFEDLGHKGKEAANLRLRSSLMIAITRIIDERDLTQQEAAALFGVPQPRISELVRGKIRLFSIDKLVSMLANAGIDVELVVTADSAQRPTRLSRSRASRRPAS